MKDTRARLDEALARLLAAALVRELRAEDNGTSGRPGTVTSGAGARTDPREEGANRE